MYVLPDGQVTTVQTIAVRVMPSVVDIAVDQLHMNAFNALLMVHILWFPILVYVNVKPIGLAKHVNFTMVIVMTNV